MLGGRLPGTEVSTRLRQDRAERAADGAEQAIGWSGRRSPAGTGSMCLVPVASFTAVTYHPLLTPPLAGQRASLGRRIEICLLAFSGFCFAANQTGINHLGAKERSSLEPE